MVLEAGERHEYADFINDEWAKLHSARLEGKRTTSG